MTLHLTTHSSTITADFDQELEVSEVRYNDEPINETEWKLKVIYDAFNNHFNLDEELSEDRWEKRENYTVNY